MPSYVTHCVNCGPQEFLARMSEASEFMPCPVCLRPRPQRFFAPQFVEDRVRLWRGVHGNRFSHALGAEMPDSRGERDRLAAEKGVEFVGKAEFLASNKEAAEAVEYKAHVDSGGAAEKSKPPALDAFKAKPAWAKGLT